MNHIVLGSFFGDEGKGQIVNNLAKVSEKALVVRFSGGPQCGHTVVEDTKEGQIKHTFSNFGSGTFQGCHTYWSKYCPFNPLSIYAEDSVLQLETKTYKGVRPILYIDPLCEIITPWDIEAQQNNYHNKKHGTVGVGFGTTLKRVKDGYSFKAVDLLYSKDVIREKMRSVCDYYHSDLEVVDSVIDLYYHSPDKLFLVKPFKKVLEDVRPSDLIFEGSQGILLDQTFGFMPHCTPSNTTGANAYELIKQYCEELKTKVHMVTRPYITRHGNGPLMVPEITVENPMEINEENLYQGKLRTGMLDLRLLRHSLLVEKSIEGIPRDYCIDVTCTDLLSNLHYMDKEEVRPCTELQDAIFLTVLSDVNFYSFGRKIYDY